jgi:Raf kinase inhibitor-like YbhB/YbcL family protein
MRANRWKAVATVAAASCSLLAGCGDDGFKLSSPDVPSGGTFAQAQVFGGCSGGNVSPELRWSNPPAGTQSFAVTMFDADAPTGSGFWHWTVFNIPASARSIPRSSGSGTSGLPSGAVQGYTDFGQSSYGGPCPPPGDPPHRYTFTVHALRVADLQLTSGAPGALVSFNAKANALASASFEATYDIAAADAPVAEPPTLAGFTLTSAEIAPGSTIGNEQVFNSFGCAGGNLSPSLTWSGAPPGTQSFVLTMFDPDAPTGSGFWHWLVFDSPATTTSLAKGAGTAGASPGGGRQGYTDFGASAYGGPCPPVGDPAHRYIFTLYALNVPSLASQGLGTGSTGAFVGFLTRPAAIAKAELRASYGR